MEISLVINIEGLILFLLFYLEKDKNHLWINLLINTFLFKDFIIKILMINKRIKLF